MAKIGFIGLGIMGQPMALNLIKGGHELAAHSRRGVPKELLQAGAIQHDSGSAVATHSDVIILMLPDTPDVERVLFDKNGVAEGLAAGKTVIDMSSISPLMTQTFAKRIEAAGSHYLDAPVSGGEVGAKAASLTIMVGGTESAFEAVRPILGLMGKTITLVGSHGAGQIAKVANQIIVALNIEAVAEALLLASRLGADPAKVRQAISGGFAGSRVLDVHGERMITRAFNPGFRIRLHKKDLALALQSANEVGVSLPATAMAQQLFNSCLAHGGENWDHSAMVKALEVLADRVVA
jgi:2-hydroxy-3-oxopropionate reductase